MNDNCCPSPIKRFRVGLFSFDSDEIDELNLSTTFDRTYQTLMNPEIVDLCLKQCNNFENLHGQNNVSEFLKRCDEIQGLIKAVSSQSLKPPQCRSELYLAKIHQGKKMLQSSRFENLKMFSTMLISVEPQLKTMVMVKINILEKLCHVHGVFSLATFNQVIEEVNKDIEDLSLWLDEVTQRLNLDISISNKITDIDFMEYILKDFEFHNEVSISVIKLVTELQESKCFSLHSDSINTVKSAIDSVETQLYQLWLTAIEYKLLLEQQPKMGSVLIDISGHENRFETELSPQNDMKVDMTNISSGGNISDHTIESPSESESEAAAIFTERSELTTSTLYSTESLLQHCDMEVLPSSKKIMRKKKRHSRRHDNVNEYNLSTEESESCGRNVNKSLMKRRLVDVSNLQLPQSPQYLPRMNYSEIAEAADRLVRNNSSQTRKCHRESELEEIIQTPKTTLYEIDLEKSWDYYQAPLYSNEDGDSEILELDKIKEWDPETDMEDVDMLLTSNSSPPTCYKRLTMLTSGYETSLESDYTSCSRSLICVLQFTTNYCHDIEQKINDIDNNVSLYSPERLICALKECNSTIEIHLKLIRRMLHCGPCTFTHNKTLTNNLIIVEKRWNSIKHKCITCQINIIENQMKALEHYGGVQDLKSSINSLKEISTTFHNVKINLNLCLEKRDKLWVNIERVDKGLLNLKVSKTKQLELVLQCYTCVAQSKCTRKLLGCDLRWSKEVTSRFNVQDIYAKFEKCILSLKQCLESVESISSIECQAQMSVAIEHEISSWSTLCNTATSATPKEKEPLPDCYTTRNPLSLCSRLFRHLPLQMATMVVVWAIMAWWYNHSSTGNCRISAADWLQLLYKFRDYPQPH